MKSYSKINRTKIREHIIEHYDRAHDDNMEPIELLKLEFKAVDYGSAPRQEVAKRLVEGGNFLIYHGDVKIFIETLNINDTNKEYSDTEAWEKYCNLLAREIINLIGE